MILCHVKFHSLTKFGLILFLVVFFYQRFSTISLIDFLNNIWMECSTPRKERRNSCFFLSIKEIRFFIGFEHFAFELSFAVCVHLANDNVCFVRLKNTQVHITPWDVETSRHLFGRYEQNVIHTRLHFLTFFLKFCFFFFCNLKKIRNIFKITTAYSIQYKYVP